MKIVVYTSIFGGYDKLIEDQFKVDGVDFICFTDEEINSSTWKIRKATPIYSDPNRNAKKFKILPHRYLKEYDWSIWIDGNIKLISDITSLCQGGSYKVYDHMQVFDKRNCIYEEAEAIFNLGERNYSITPERGIKNWKDNPEVIKKQIGKYQEEGFPTNIGLATNPIIIRKHNDLEVIKNMEDWWEEIVYNSKRDQLSFNYIAWKNKFDFVYLEGDSRNNKYFTNVGKHVGKK